MDSPRAAQIVSHNVKNRLAINITFQMQPTSLPNLSVFPAAGNNHSGVKELLG
jgi:hypothetical protein